MKSLFFLAAAVLSQIAFSQSVVYDNTVTFTHHGMPWITNQWATSAEMGDEVVLAGTEREIVEIKIRLWYAGTTPGTFDARVRFRDLDPNDMISGPATVKDGKIIAYRNTPRPNKVIYEGPLVKGLKIEPGMNEFTFKIPHVKVPDRFVWTIQGYNRKGTNDNFGPAYYNPPVVGWSDDFFWQSQDGSPWIAYSWGGDLPANFGARIIAVNSAPGAKGSTRSR